MRLRLSRRSLFAFFAVLGPGFVTASAGNDVGGIATYSAAGAQFGYATLWSLLALTLSLIVVQEMAGRMGAVTGQGLAGLIRENFGLRITFVTMLALFFVNTGIAATEFAGIAAASELFGISRFIAIPASMAIVFLLVLRLPNKIVERVFVVFSLIYLTYVVSGVLAHPNWSEVARDAVVPRIVKNPAFLVTIVGLIGTTISPYMQFFLQSQVVDKGSRARDLPAIRADIIVGSVLAIALAGFMIVANGATIFQATLHGGHPIDINANPQAVDFARALEPLAGHFAEVIFALGILNAGLFTAAVLPLSTAYIVCEAFGLEASLDRRFREAPVFYSLFAGAILLAAGLVLLVPKESLFKLIIYAQVVQGVLLPLELVLMLVIVNRPRVMGSHVNTRTLNAIAWATAIVIGSLALVYVWQSLTGA
ncbi:Mn transporter [Vulcanimicrobium alpinum]|uniref:Mn transporter n=1 Tax=Vulcanimicrobium alpinum TaxID=3016050 RepID=A0AAN1XXD5_UNVUL|nr:divalent metal cation transporter [Vulcanimicrobium alpinum]BDE07127.1 Mn transporter [Vulcanimicrobium alpinum]